MDNRNFNPVELIKVQLNDVKKSIRLQELLCSRFRKYMNCLLVSKK
ncbi:hypothetical protein [Fictibacillus sp. NRS-1165]